MVTEPTDEQKREAYNEHLRSCHLCKYNAKRHQRKLCQRGMTLWDAWRAVYVPFKVALSK